MDEYRLVAPAYDLILYPFMRGIRRDVLGLVKQINPGRTIDVCCGTGDQLRLLQQEGIEAIGVDLSRAMLKAAGRGKLPVTCLAQDATAMAFKGKTFDLAMIAFALHETEWEKALLIVQEIHRILKPGGKLLVVDYAFNKRTNPVAKVLIRAIEFMAGRRHFTNFLHYNHKGGLEQLIDPRCFVPIKDRFHGQRSIVVRMLQKKD